VAPFFNAIRLISINNLRRQCRGAGQCHAIEETAAIDETPVARTAHIFLLIELIPMLGVLPL
jgi:hypothetical protein